ncbi:Similar to CG15014: THUMP domain-containing protein 1 homolog (Drosophila melanogaster) [Cotesia congregata]|uniref:Similar to CG15014: THUMP domain-containing protein 1 homolog (Drosophila melanogaster) n=1 Tax=Cotesia congregata TaxID=51543 RepID=A0A8J2H8Z1_COTCN|nr:Similar to CG15014: THUMP domain-containing protein 1 homolog (Drosophila melanogaster) [Cotesia congregata]
MDIKDNKRKWYKPATHYTKKSKYSIEVGLSGFLCTCNFREKESIRDAYRLLEEYHGDSKKLDEQKQDVKDNGVADKVDQEDEDISVSLSKEIEELNDQKKPDSVKTFQIIKDLAETKKQKSRFLLRFIPIQVVSKANINDITTKATILFEKYFAQEPKTFSIVFNRHCNNTIKREVIIEALAGIVFKKNPGNKADLKNPEIAVIVEIIKGWCFLAVAPDYFKYKKYNLFELCNDNKDKAEVRSNVAKKDQDQGKEADEDISNQKAKDENNEKVEDQGQAKVADKEDQDQDKEADQDISNQKPKDETSSNENNEKVEDQGQPKEADKEIVKEDLEDKKQ